jgi:hypothetical protein
MEIVAALDKEGKQNKWEGKIVSRYEAVRRWREGQDIIRRNHDAGNKFLFSLTNSDYVLVPANGGDSNQEQLLRVTVISGNRIEFVLHSDARPITLRKKEKDRIIYSVSTLGKLEARKVSIDPLGCVLVAKD